MRAGYGDADQVQGAAEGRRDGPCYLQAAHGPFSPFDEVPARTHSEDGARAEENAATAPGPLALISPHLTIPKTNTVPDRPPVVSTGDKVSRGTISLKSKLNKNTFCLWITT